MNRTPVLLAIGVLIALGGCDRAPVAKATEGARAQAMVEVTDDHNDFVGIWASPPSQTVNDWIVIFTPSGYVAVDGPGLKADGTYDASGATATVHYETRNGKSPRDAQLANATFELSSDRERLVFATGNPGDAPVELVRSDLNATDSRLRLSAPPAKGMPINPMSMAWLR